ncbi:MAG: NAD(P)-dependent methylenetetrahydromethanopterin dehydrogenase, partial [Halobacteriota archaeon]|nr:NAD(P)-dependent methylenetetrahydromethanopterin dehydrogenase [Halobacteriota archaeon]
MKDIMLLLDTDKHSTPFDILMAYDSGFDAIVPYEEVEPDDVAGIVQDAMFSRGVKGSNSTTIFVGGTDVEKSMEIFQRAVKSMVTPFELSVIFDPRGGHTTASALVAKIEEALVENSYGGLEGKKVAILAGTGQVGQLAAIICSSKGAEVTITSRKASKSEGIVKRIEEETGYKIKALQGATSEEIYDAIKEADVVVATGKAGVQLVPMDMLEKLKNCKVVADVNAVPPLGIAGLDVRDDKREIIPGIYGVGALATGDLKYKTETRVLNEARKSKSGVFDYKFAFEKARELLKKKA